MKFRAGMRDSELEGLPARRGGKGRAGGRPPPAREGGQQGGAGKGARRMRGETCPEQVQEVTARSLWPSENKLRRVLSNSNTFKKEKKHTKQLAKIKFAICAFFF